MRKMHCWQNEAILYYGNSKKNSYIALVDLKTMLNPIDLASGSLHDCSWYKMLIEKIEMERNTTGSKNCTTYLRSDKE